MMENKKDIVIIFLVMFIIFLGIVNTRNVNTYHSMVTPLIESNKEDSLRMVINDLISEKQLDEDGWDKKERTYEEILFEYEYGLEHLKQYYPNAYREFHRIIGYKEMYSRETEKENKKRLHEYNR